MGEDAKNNPTVLKTRPCRQLMPMARSFLAEFKPESVESASGSHDNNLLADGQEAGETEARPTSHAHQTFPLRRRTNLDNRNSKVTTSEESPIRCRR